MSRSPSGGGSLGSIFGESISFQPPANNPSRYVVTKVSKGSSPSTRYDSLVYDVAARIASLSAVADRSSSGRPIWLVWTSREFGSGAGKGIAHGCAATAAIVLSATSAWRRSPMSDGSPMAVDPVRPNHEQPHQVAGTGEGGRAGRRRAVERREV